MDYDRGQRVRAHADVFAEHSVFAVGDRLAGCRRQLRAAPRRRRRSAEGVWHRSTSGSS